MCYPPRDIRGIVNHEPIIILFVGDIQGLFESQNLSITDIRSIEE